MVPPTAQLGWCSGIFWHKVLWTSMCFIKDGSWSPSTETGAERETSPSHCGVIHLSCPAALGEGVDSFVQCPLEALSWSRRKYLILEEILTYRPHILCLQEVDHYYDTFQPVLSGLGYGSNFCPKPWSPCLDVEGNNGPDGCALFFDESSFELLDSVNIRLCAIRIPTNQVSFHRPNVCNLWFLSHMWLFQAAGHQKKNNIISLSLLR